MLSSITRFLRDEEGATAIEYGIIAGLMAIILIGIFSETSGIGKALIDKIWVICIDMNMHIVFQDLIVV